MTQASVFISDVGPREGFAQRHSGSSIMGRDDGVRALGGRGEACKAGREASDARMRAGKRTRGGKLTTSVRGGRRGQSRVRSCQICTPGLGGFFTRYEVKYLRFRQASL